MKAIVAIDSNWGIGKDGDLLFRIKEDMEFFKKMTLGKVVVMGRKTFDSLPGKKPLKDRTNLIVTTGVCNRFYNNAIYGDIGMIKNEIRKYNSDDVFIIGGESIYKQFIHKCDTVYVTRRNKLYDADVFMPNLAFEGFELKQIIHQGDDWCIEEWVYEGPLTKYNSVVYACTEKEQMFLYSNDLFEWKYIHSDKPCEKVLKLALKLLTELNILHQGVINITKVNKQYRAEINDSGNNYAFRISALGNTFLEAARNLDDAITNLN